MRKPLSFLLPILFLAFASSALADNVDFTATGTIAPSGPTFTFTFSEPSTLTSLDFLTTVDFSSGALHVSNIPAEIEFFATSASGLFDIFASVDGFDHFQFFGPQSYSGSGPFTLLTGSFPVTGGDMFVGDNIDPSAFLTGGTVTTTSVTPTPEPATFALLASGLFAMGALLKKKRLA